MNQRSDDRDVPDAARDEHGERHSALAGQTLESTPPPAEVEALYRAETARTVRNRLDLTVLLLLVFVGIGVVIEQRAHPERMWQVTLTYLLEAVIGLSAVAACRVERLAAYTVPIAAAMGCMLAIVDGVYIRVLAGDVQSLAMAQVCLMSGLAVMVPWGWRAQVAVCVAALGGFYLRDHRQRGAGARAVGRPRRLGRCDHLVHRRGRAGALPTRGLRPCDELSRAYALQQEEAEISHRAAARRPDAEPVHRPQRAARAGEPDGDRRARLRLQHHLRPRLGENAFRFVANVGSRTEVRTELENIEFPPDSMPIFAQLRQGRMVEISRRGGAAAGADRAAARAGRWRRCCATPIYRNESRIARDRTGYRKRAGPFSRKQRRLLLGIAHAVAIALENERLIARPAVRRTASSPSSSRPCRTSCARR